MYARILRFLLAATMAAVLVGCSTSKKNTGTREEYHPVYKPRNVVALAKIPVNVRRVVMLPVCWERDANSDFVTDLDTILLLSLQRANAFEVVPMTREQMYKHFGSYQLSSVQILPNDMLKVLAKEYDAQAILFIDLTVNRPYHPISIGLRAKLVRQEDAGVIWAVDSLFDSADPAVARAALDFSTRSTYNPYPVDNSGGILLSPRAFAGFVADTLFSTLPPR